MRVATSDWHLGGGGLAEDGNEAGIRWVVETALRYPDLDALIICGDWFELWQFRLEECLKAHAELLAWLDAQLSARGILLHWVQGNHDGVRDLSAALGAIRAYLPHVLLIGHRDSVRLGGWRYLHGHQFDVWNRPGWLQPLAHGFTWLAGRLERLIPGFDENKANPRNWFSPARATRESLHAAITQLAAESSDAYGDRVVYGHTHRPGVLGDHSVVNVGCCIGERAACAALWDDGRVVLHELTR